MHRRTSLVRRTTLRVRSPRRSRFEAELDAVTPVLGARSQGMCEAQLLGVCAGRAVHRHHRKRRSQGGGNELANLVHCCEPCHTFLHAHPAVAYAAGLLVFSTDDPADVPLRAWGVAS